MLIDDILNLWGRLDIWVAVLFPILHKIDVRTLEFWVPQRLVRQRLPTFSIVLTSTLADLSGQ